MNMLMTRAFYLLVMATVTRSWSIMPKMTSCYNRRRTVLSSSNPGFDGEEFDAALKSLGGVWDKELSQPDANLLNSIREVQAAEAEEIYRGKPLISIVEDRIKDQPFIEMHLKWLLLLF